MKANTNVRITKLAEHKPGLVKVGEWAEGVLIDDVRVGECVEMIRYRRSAVTEDEANLPVECAGQFNTSTVMSVEDAEPDQNMNLFWIITTRNSTWRLDVLS